MVSGFEYFIFIIGMAAITIWAVLAGLVEYFRKK